MGYSVRTEAAMVVERWEAVCRIQGGGSNVFEHEERGRVSSYMFEQDSVDLPDGGACGELLRMVPGTYHAIPIGRWGVSGDGQTLTGCAPNIQRWLGCDK